MIKVEQHIPMLEEVLHGLSQLQKTLPSKFFYDERGSKLFDKITELEEYYPTRTERKILTDNVDEIEAFLGKRVVLIEPGSGSSDKTKILLQKLDNVAVYMPMDISGEYLFKVADELQQAYPDIEIQPIEADYTESFELPDVMPEGRKVVFFPGSTIGNFKRGTVDRFLNLVADVVKEKGGFLIGVDLKKDIETLKAAYNDSLGITAEFNKNMLKHLNRMIGTEFDVEKFEHEAIWNEEESRIEMHLIAKERHEVEINGSKILFEEGESIHTENSHKYTLEEFAEIVAPWFEVKKVWTDENNLFSLQYLELK